MATVSSMSAAAAGQDDGDRDPEPPGGVEDEAVALPEAVDREPEPPAGLFVGVRAGDVQNEIRTELLQEAGDMGLDLGQVLDVAVARPQTHVERPRRLLGRVDVHLVDGEREHVLPARERGGRPVSLMEVAVDDEHPLDQPLRPQGLDGHGHVVEDAALAGGRRGGIPCDMAASLSTRGLAGRRSADDRCQSAGENGLRAARSAIRVPVRSLRNSGRGAGLLPWRAPERGSPGEPRRLVEQSYFRWERCGPRRTSVVAGRRI
jgi:hypothetical protein